MTPEVKQRIEQIQQGIVPKGYKKTKSDIVPVDWKESPIGKYIREYTEKTTIPNQYPVLTSARTGLMLQTDYYSNRQVTTENNVGYNVLPYGYITFRSRSDDGRFRFNENRIIERGIISYFYPVFSFSEEVCHEYMLYLLNFSIYRRMYPYAEGTAQQVLSLKKLGQLKYSLPLVAEQKKIAEILATQDKAIELQERKIDELKRFKKGCLEKMFPMKGQKVPEKRFPGFTDDWEQRKLRELAIFNPKAELPDTFEYVDLESVVGTEMLSHRTESKQSAPSRAQRLAQTGDLFYQTVRPYQKNNYLFEKPDKYYVFSTGYAQMRPVVDGRFLLCLVQNDRFVKVVLDNCTGTSYPAINSNDLAEIDVYSPNNPQEQKQIGDFFKDLDNLITLHQRKLEEMKRRKKALMQLLLTGIVRVRL